MKKKLKNAPPNKTVLTFFSQSECTVILASESGSTLEYHGFESRTRNSTECRSMGIRIRKHSLSVFYCYKLQVLDFSLTFVGFLQFVPCQLQAARVDESEKKSDASVKMHVWYPTVSICYGPTIAHATGRMLFALSRQRSLPAETPNCESGSGSK
jgi:hypothetical protein